jgi:hypothetical protein
VAMTLIAARRQNTEAEALRSAQDVSRAVPTVTRLPWFTAMLLLSVVMIRGADAARPTPSAGSRELTLEMDLQQIEVAAHDGLRLLATMPEGDKKAVLEIHVPPKNVTRGDKVRGTGAATYRFPVYLRASDVDGAVFQRAIAAHFGAKAPNSFVRKEEYGGGALQKPGKLGKEGGTIFLTDPTGTPFNWEITLQIDPAKHRLKLKARETRY